jgi:hypothetical protein
VCLRSFQIHLGKDLCGGKRLRTVQGCVGEHEAGLIFLQRFVCFGESGFEKPHIHRGERLIYVDAVTR